MKIIIRSKYPTRPINQTKGGEKKMKHFRTILTLGIGAFVLATAAFLTNTWAKENVRMTRHNLSANPNIAASGTTEVCIFCHTPHGGAIDVGGGAAPLWNRNMTTMTPSANFVEYSSPNFDAIGNTPGKPKGVSLACLSCHDGSLAFDQLANFPGSGSVDAITFSAGNNVTAQGMMKNNPDVSPGAAGEFPMLGTNLSNDHPVSMEVPCGASPVDQQFAQICANLAPNGVKVSYITRDAGIFPADTRDRLRTYPTNGAGTYYIECASCHNPHEASRPGADGSTATDTANSRFLRHPSAGGTILPLGVITAAQLDTDRNAGSLLCLSCHQK